MHQTKQCVSCKVLVLCHTVYLVFSWNATVFSNILFLFACIFFYSSCTLFGCEIVYSFPMVVLHKPDAWRSAVLCLMSYNARVSNSLLRQSKELEFLQWLNMLLQHINNIVSWYRFRCLDFLLFTFK